MNPREERHKEKAERLFRRGRFQKALRVFFEASEMNPGDQRLRLRIAETLLELNRCTDARILMRQIGDAYLADGQIHKAVAVFHRLLDLDRNDREAQAKLALLYERQQKEPSRELPTSPDQIQEMVKEACREDAERAVLSVQAEFDQAKTRKDWPRALELALKLWRLQPASIETRLALGDVLERMERKEEAADLLFHAAGGFMREGNLLRAAMLRSRLAHLQQENKGVEVGRRLAILSARIGRAHGLGTLEAANEERGFRLFSSRSAAGRKDVMEDLLEHVLADPADVARIRPLPIISHLPRREIEALLGSLTAVRFGKGEIIFEPGTPASSIYWIAHGEVGITLSSQEGTRPEHSNEAQVRRETEVLGGAGFLFGGRRTARATALTPVELLELPRHQVERLGIQFPAITQALDSAFLTWVLPDLLRLHPFFSRLSREDLLALSAAFSTRRYESGSFELRAGEVPPTFYVIREGLLDVYASADFSRRADITLAAGAIVAEAEWMGRAPLPFGLRAAGPVTLLVFSMDTLQPVEKERLFPPDQVENWLRERLTRALAIGNPSKRFEFSSALG